MLPRTLTRATPLSGVGDARLAAPDLCRRSPRASAAAPGARSQSMPTVCVLCSWRTWVGLGLGLGLGLGFGLGLP